MKRLTKFAPAIALFLALTQSNAHAAAPPGPYFNGFEQNTNGWFDTSNGGNGKITRRPSGYSNAGGYADGIPSASGHWHAHLMGDPCARVPGSNCYGPFTRWGGYTSTFPPGGYLTQVDIYLDVAWAATHPDYRFDWSSAINQSVPSSPPTHRRDWVFNVGTELPTDTVPKFNISASTNAFRDSTFPENDCPSPPDLISNPPAGCRKHAEISTSGWYTFRHTFRAGSFPGCPETQCLIVDFDIFNHGSGAQVAHWTIHSSQDPMSTVGGNRYGWFANEEIPDLAIDNSLRTGLCHEGDGDGEEADNDSGRKHHTHFHRKSCSDQNDSEPDNVQSDDEQTGSHFQSASIATSTFDAGENSQTVSMVGTGLHDGLPVGFTMIAVDNGGLAPAVIGIVLTDGYTFTGSLTSGSITIR